MRLRNGVMLVLAAAVAGCGAAHRAAGPAGPERSLQHQLQLFLAQTPLTPHVPRLPRVIVAPPLHAGGPCFVASRGGPCSLVPCIVYVQRPLPQTLPPVLVAPGAGRCPAGSRISQVLRVSGP